MSEHLVSYGLETNSCLCFFPSLFCAMLHLIAGSLNWNFLLYLQMICLLVDNPPCFSLVSVQRPRKLQVVIYIAGK